MNAPGVHPTTNAASIFALSDMDGANVPIESESMMASSSSHNHTISNATDIESMSESRVSNATDLNDIVIADSRPDVLMRMDRPIVPKLPVAKGLGMTQPSAVRDARRSAPYQSQSPNRSEFPRPSTISELLRDLIQSWLICPLLVIADQDLVLRMRSNPTRLLIL